MKIVPSNNQKFTKLMKSIYRMEAYVSIPTFKHYINSTSILIHMTIDRINALETLASYWKGPLVIVLFLSEAQDLKYFKKSFEKNKDLKKYAYLHIVYDDYPHMDYPVNFLRNVAVEYSKTNFIISLDVDFVPNIKLYDQLNEMINGDMVFENTAYVIPAFEVKEKKIQRYPLDKMEMVECIQNDTGIQVHKYKGLHSHLPTNYERWIAFDINYSIDYEYTYEPYLFLFKKNLPLYHETFIGYGNDKTSFTLELEASKFKFVVLSNSFIVHQSHPSGSWSKNQGSEASWMKWWEFNRYLAWKYSGFEYQVPQWLKDDCEKGDCPRFWEWKL
ncbi:hypothetical protein CYY_001745 [Polysphondylium violaceum]|uniref:Glycosyltransferase n=1 Tax=Polysphondylium violaceum TaxID=133409 RepID=A0A8J4Q1B3_9MYCE|nr:hypothetical protein CYY_001745 [Polysphondylium violaceum]